MKMGKMIRATSSVKNGEVVVEVPLRWTALTDGQRRYVCDLLSAEQWSLEEVKALLMVRLAGDGAKLWRGAKRQGDLAMQVADGMALLDWMDAPPEEPALLGEIDGCKAKDAMLQGVAFRDYLAIENFYQGYLMSQNDAALDAMGGVVYGGLCRPLTRGERYMLLLWMVGLKACYARLFPHLFSHTAEDGGEVPDAREVMCAEIRALTGGDITKQATVLNADTIDALTELDAKARESEEISNKY